MKKNGILTVLLGVALVFSGCKKEEKITFDEFSQFKDIDTSSYVTIGNYKGLSITPDTLEVSDYEIDSKVDSVLYEHGYYVDANDKPVTAGTQIKISMNGSIDGKINDGFTYEGYQFVYGYGEYVMEGFTKNLEGLYQGDTVNFDLQVPSSFGETALIGKTVTFNVSVDNVQTYFVPELTDEFIQEISDANSIEEYRQSILPTIREEKMESIRQDKKLGVWKVISDNSTINSYPEGTIEAKTEQLKERIEFYAMVYGLDLETYVQNYYGVSFEEYVKLSLKQDLLLDAIGRAENITMTQSEYEESAAAYATQNGYNDTKTMVEAVGEEKVKEALLWDKVMNYIADQVTIQE